MDFFVEDVLAAAVALLVFAGICDPAVKACERQVGLDRPSHQITAAVNTIQTTVKHSSSDFFVSCSRVACERERSTARHVTRPISCF